MATLLYVGLSNAILATVLALFVAGIACFCRKRPALVHSLWLLVLLKLVTPPVLSVPIPWPAAPAFSNAADTGAMAPAPAPSALPAPLAAPPAAPEEPASVLSEDPPAAVVSAEPFDAAPPASTPPASPASSSPWADVPWKPVLVVFWLAGSCLWWAVASLRLWHFQRTLRYARPAPEALQKQALQLARRLGLAQCPDISFVTASMAPLLWAVAGPPRLLLPAVLWDRLDADQRVTLLAHELAHLKRRDHWVRRLELLVLGLYWWHPVAWWARRELQEAEEQCCDAWVVWALPGAAFAYAETLLHTVRFLSQAHAVLPLGASGIGQVHLLKRRMAMVLSGTTPRGLPRAGLVAMLGLGAVLLPLLPGWGQTPTRQRNAEEQPAPVRRVEQATDTPRAAAPALTPVAPVPAAELPHSRTSKSNARNSEQVEAAQDEVDLLKA